MDEETPQPQSESDNPEKKDRIQHRVLQSGDGYGNYKVVRCLCAGLIANYYHMQHVRDLHDVTIGIFHPRSLKDSKFLKRLQGLQKQTNILEHEAIPKVHEIAEIDERHCIFLDHIEGSSLSDFFEEHGKAGVSGVGTEMTTKILAQLLGALGYAHVMKLDHRDLDSDLIFVRKEGRLQMLGLGIKAAVGVELFESIVSASVSPLVSNKVAGRLNSFDVMSPEYRSGVAEDARVDIYGSAVVGFWLLTGTKANNRSFIPPSTKIDNLSPGWDVFFEKSLKYDREERYASCKSALHGLKEADGGVNSVGSSQVQKQIELIPVPKSILARGHNATRVYRISLIGLVGLTLVATVLFFVLNGDSKEKEGIPVEAEIRVASVTADGEAPDLRLRVTPDVAKVQFQDTSDQFALTDGVLELNIELGEYRVEISSEGFVGQFVDVVIENKTDDGDTKNSEATNGGPREVVVELERARTGLEVVSTAGASITVFDDSGQEVALWETNADGVVTVEAGLAKGTYNFRVEKPGYIPMLLENQILEPSEFRQLSIPLEASPATVQISSNPEGALVVVNQEEAGKTPLLLESIDPNKELTVALYKDGYRAIGRRVMPKPGEVVEMNFGDLERLSGELRFSVSFSGRSELESEALRSGVFVELGEQRYPIDAPELAEVGEGQYLVRVVHPLYSSSSMEVRVGDKQTVDIPVVFEPKPAIVEIDLPDGLEPHIRVNGEVVTISEQGIVVIPPYRSIELEVLLADYLTTKRELNMGPTERLLWELNPVPIPSPERGKDYSVPYLGVKFAWVEPGTFTMGSPLAEPGRLAKEGPPTEITFTRGFWAGVYEVTQDQYKQLMASNPSDYQGGQRPVDQVLWKQAREYCALLTAFEKKAGRLPAGYVYRLPTEAEWEYVARADTTTPFSFGERGDVSCGVFRGVYPPGSDEGIRTADHYGTLSVGSFRPNPWGLYDVHGNVAEWTIERYNGRLPGEPLADPSPRVDGSRIAVRGGSWEDFAKHVRSASRTDVSPSTKSNAIGFRVFLAPELNVPVD